MIKLISGLALSALISGNALANDANLVQEDGSDISFSAFMGYSVGGEKLVEINYKDNSDQSIKTGKGFSFGLGLNYSISEKWSLATNLSYFSDSDNAENLDAKISRFVLDAIPYYQLNEKFKIGLGLTYHLSPELEVESSKLEFDSALGSVVSIGYELESYNSMIEVRYVSNSYDYNEKVYLGYGSYGSYKGTVDANQFGVFWHYQF
ncbi:hypothetical protein [Pseudoalteromonas sp. MTN2-4]|uniref:hypothetical protein n=1 Tax=Pseudoalteromonas sp. MTN2-4 TaxID=3056555 RepID=UPI0036F274F3